MNITDIFAQMETIVSSAESANRGFYPSELEQFNSLKATATNILEVKEMQPQGSLKKVQTPAVHTKRHTIDPMDYVRHTIDPSSVDFGPLKEHSQELGKDVPQELRGNGIYIKRSDLFGVQKSSGTGSGANMAPLTGVDYADQLFDTTGDAITAAAPLGGLPIIEVETNERSMQIPVQTAQCSVGSVAVDADVPASSDPAFSTQTTEPHKRGAVTTALLSTIWANHPAFGVNPLLEELGRAYRQETDRVIVYGDDGNAGEYDGLAILATAATAGLDVSATTLAEAYAIVQELEDYMQMELTSENGGQWLMNPNFVNLLRTVPEFTGATSSNLELLSGIFANLPIRRSVGLAVTDATPDTSDAFLVGKPSTIVHVNYGTMRLDVNPWETSVYKKSAFMLRVFGLDDLVVVDPKKILTFTATHGASA